MKNRLLFLVIALMNILYASASGWEIDGIFYDLREGDGDAWATEGTASVCKPDSGYSYTGLITIPTSVSRTKHIYITDGVYEDIYTIYKVLAIADRAFEGQEVSSVIIPNSVGTIQYCAFYNCSKLENITIGDSVTYIGHSAFYNCPNLTSVVIPNSVTTLSTYRNSGVFKNCSGLLSLTIGNGLASTGSNTFENCSSLTFVNFSEGLKYIASESFLNCTSLSHLDLPNSVISIGEKAFKNCSSLKTIKLSENITEIGKNAFNNCEKLDSVVLPNNIKIIGANAFYACKSLSSIVIPDSVTNIGSGAFENCTSLIYAKIGKNITNFERTFYNCSSLKYIEIPNGISSTGSLTFSYCSSLDSIMLPKSVVSIGSNAFSNCSALTNISIPNSVTSIGSSAFYNCRGLEYLVLSDSIKSIGSSAFSGCSNLTICVPASAEIGSLAFSGCKKVIYYTDRIGDYWFNDTILTGYTGNETELELPYTHNGQTYTVAASAFEKLNTPITSILIPHAVTSIGNYAFRNVRTLKKVELPVTLTDIAPNAFYNCDSIASVSMGLHESTPSIKTLFSSSINKSLKEFIALEGSTLVGTKKGGNNYQMFTNNRIIETIKIPYTVEVIADSTFMNCYNLKSITIGYKTVAEGEPESSPHHIKRHLLSEDNDTLRIYKVRIGDCEFQNDTSVTVLVLEDGVEEIGYKAFENCRKLTNITIPNTVKSIGFQAFNKCSKLTDLALYCDFQALLKNGGSYGEQFRDCKSIKNIKLKQRRKIGTGELQPLTRVFASSLTSIESLEWINSSDTICWTDATSSDKMEDIPALRSVKLYEGITGIGNGAFKGSTLLTDIYLPLSLKHIGECAFMNCGIEDMYLFENVETIGKSTLANCANLKKLFIKSGKLEIIPASFCSNNPSLDTIGWPISSKIWAIGESAFANCTSLGVIHIRPSVTTIHSDAFNGCTSVYRLSSLAVTPPIFVDNIYTTTTSSGGLKGVNVENLEKFSVPHKSRNLYANADVWKKYWINGIAATFDDNSTTLANNETTTETTPNSVNLSFADDADSYQLNIDGESYTVASYQNGNHQNPSPARRTKMEEGIPGIMFTLTGLKPDTEYSYTITAFDENMDTLSVEIGNFRTQAEESMSPIFYQIRFLNWDGEILQTDSVEADSIPVYIGAMPTKPEDAQYSYVFTGWSPAIVAATTDADYTAQFTAIEKPTVTIPTVSDLATAGYDIDNNIVLCLRFVEEATVCYDIVVSGSYNSWGTDPSTMLHMQPLAGFEGWYVAQFTYQMGTDGNNNPTLPQAKPIQLKNDGTVSWDYQSGDVKAWTYKGGVCAYVVQGFDNEADIYYPEKGAYIYEISYWKNHNTPCIIIPKHNYTIHLYAPDACEEMQPAIIGGFNNWTENVSMIANTDAQENRYYSCSLYTEEGTEFKFREVNDNTWANQIQEFNETYNVWIAMSNLTLPVTAEDVTVTYDFSDNTKFRFSLCNNTGTVVDNISEEASETPKKFMIDNVILILRGDKTYTLTGQEVK